MLYGHRRWSTLLRKLGPAALLLLLVVWAIAGIATAAPESAAPATAASSSRKPARHGPAAESASVPSANPSAGAGSARAGQSAVAAGGAARRVRAAGEVVAAGGTAASVAAAEPAATATAAPFVAALPAPSGSLTDAQLDTQLDRARALLRLRQLNRAAVAFRRIAAARPHDIAAWEGLRNTLIAARHEERLPDVLVRLADLYLADGDRTAAGRRLDELVVLAPQNPARHRLEAQLGRVGDDDPAPGTTAATTSIAERLRGLLGIVVLLGLAVLLSNNRRKISLRLVGWGLALQVVFALIILHTGLGRAVFDATRMVINRVLAYTDAGAGFLFGSIYQGVTATKTSGPVMYVDGTSGDLVRLGTIFAFHVLPTIIFFGALMSVLYHYGIIQFVVRGIASLMRRTMGTSGAESLSAAGNIFVGQTEAPLLVKPYVGDMTMSELMAIMVGGFATVAGSVMAAYARFGIDPGHLLAASVMSAPAALVMAKIMYPEVGTPRTKGGTHADTEKATENVIDAAATGAADGMRLALNVAAMLLAFIALIALLNGLLGWVGGLVGLNGLSLAKIFGWLFYPLSWCMGVNGKDLLSFGNLLGTKMAINEFVAYVELGHLRHVMDPRTVIIATYALCGFSNFSSIGIQIGGIGGIAPHRRGDLARIGLKAMFAGAFASWMTACIAGILL